MAAALFVVIASPQLRKMVGKLTGTISSTQCLLLHGAIMGVVVYLILRQRKGKCTCSPAKASEEEEQASSSLIDNVIGQKESCACGLK